MHLRANLFVLLASLAFTSIGASACSDSPGNDTSTDGPKDAGPQTPWWDVATGPPSTGGGGNADATSAGDAGVDDASDSVDAVGATDAGGGNDADASGGSADAGDGGSGTHQDAGACPAGGTAEIEPNDSVAKATAFTSIACGTITPASDVDVWTFTLPANAQHLNVHFDGGVTLTVSSSGDTITVPGSGTMPFHAGAPYTITVRSASAHAEAYDLTLQF